MIILEFNNLKNLNVSLQVGDAIYARDTGVQQGATDLQQAGFADTGANHWIGILRRIVDNGNDQYDLFVDDTVTGTNFQTGTNDFIMFSKHDQSDGDLLGYYAEAKFVNDSKTKAELYVVSSEVIINSK